jgi:hypothetical protein
MRSHVLGLLATLLTFVLGALAFGWFIGLGAPHLIGVPRPFNSKAWKAADTDTNLRCNMLLDLENRIGLVGKTETEIRTLLGTGDNRESGPPRYYLLCPSFLDIYIIELEWKDGRVASSLVRDT